MKTVFTVLMMGLGLTAMAQGYKIGDKVKDFTLKNVDGNMVSLETGREAKGAIVVFTCNHCPFAQAYEQRIIELNAKYASLGYPVIAINPNDPVSVPEDSYGEMQKRAAEKSYTFPYLIDETQEVAKAFGATRTPHTFVLQLDKGKYVVKYIGAIDNNTESAEKATEKYVEKAVDALIDGKKVETTEVKAIGCTIKWKKS